MGSWELNLATGERIWSAQHYRNHGFEPAEAPPELDRLLERMASYVPHKTIFQMKADEL